MKAIEHRAGMEPDYDFETYVINKKIPSQSLSNHFSDGIQFHNNLVLSFLNMAPSFFYEGQQQV